MTGGIYCTIMVGSGARFAARRTGGSRLQPGYRFPCPALMAGRSSHDAFLRSVRIWKDLALSQVILLAKIKARQAFLYLLHRCTPFLQW